MFPPDDSWHSDDPAIALESMLGSFSDRKLRLYLVGCCRRRWELFTDPVVRYAVDTAEKFADGQATDHQRRQAEKLMLQLFAQGAEGLVGFGLYLLAQAGHSCCVDAEDLRTAYFDTPGHRRLNIDDGPRALARLASQRIAATEGGGVNRREWAELDERRAQAALLRCIVGEPDRFIVLDPQWLTSSVLGVAQTIYDTNDFHVMPILADALEEAGCCDESILAHCREVHEHVRGCWVIDTIFNRL
jgi:hypothetical protein